MKNIFLLTITIVLTLTSCSNNTIEISKEEYDKLKQSAPPPVKPKYPKPFEIYYGTLKYDEDGIVLGSDGHEYLVIDTKYSSQVITHYIECELCASRAAKSIPETIKPDTLK